MFYSCDLLFIFGSRGLEWHKEAKVQSYSPGGANVPSWEAHWRQLVNTIEPRDVDAALSQITLTTVVVVVVVRPHRSTTATGWMFVYTI